MIAESDLAGVHRVGFTGTQRGMSREQKTTVAWLLKRMTGEFHHGDCIGADAQAHDLARHAQYVIVLHPPMFSNKRAWCSADVVLPARPYLDRNKDIVLASQAVIATPAQRTEQLRSGTWSTVRAARRHGRRLFLVFPDGTIGQ